MTVRGGGVPDVRMAQCRDVDWVRRLGACCRCVSLHHGLGLWPYRIQGCGTIHRATNPQLPSNFVIPDTLKCAVVLEALKDEPLAGVAPILERFCARRHSTVGSGRGNGRQVEQ